jgi:hypothetical protein
MTSPRAFVIRGFGIKKNSAGQLIDFERGSIGSTANMVRLARALGRFQLSVIDSRQLLS